MIDIKKRIAVAMLSMSAAGFTAWQASESFTAEPVIPTKGDRPTIGNGSTRYEDGTPVRMSDEPITVERAMALAKNLNQQEEIRFKKTIPGVALSQAEFDLYMDFVGQYGMDNWIESSMRRQLLAGNYKWACRALLRYRLAAGYDCSTLINGKPNKRCYGVWTRQQARYKKCMEAQ